MSTDTQPPSPTPTAWLSSRIRSSINRKNKSHQSHPTAMEEQPSRRNHGRSSSFNEFVSRLFPAHRSEKGYTLREQYNDDDIQSPVDIVFGLLSEHKSSGKNSKERDEKIMNEMKDSNRFDGPISAGVDLRRSGALRRAFGSFRKTRKEEVAVVPLPIVEMELPVVKAGESVVEAKPEITKTQQMYEDKKVRREQRRSLRESDDYLGIQGANPRTGFWDVSDGTTASDPSQLSDETKKKLDERERRFQEAQAELRKELERVQILRDNKKKWKAEQKKLDMRMKQRKHGKWNVGDNGWSSIAEPALSPIEQSAPVTPITAAVNRLFPIALVADPTPFIDTKKTLESKDYFGHRTTFSPLARDWIKDFSVDAATPNSNVSIRRKPVGSPSRRKNDDSSKTVIHNSAEHIEVQPSTALPRQLTKTTPVAAELAPQTQQTIIPVTPPQRRGIFLEDMMKHTKTDYCEESAATATSYPSVLTKQVMIHQPLARNPLASALGRQLILLDSHPPVHLEGPIITQVPSGPPKLSGLYPIWVPPTREKKNLNSHISSTNIHITIITGHAHPPFPVTHFDGPGDLNVQTKRQLLQLKPSRIPIPMRTSSQPKEKQNNAQNMEFHAPLVDVDTSSENLVEPTKYRTTRMCHTLTPKGDKVGTKNTHISTSTYHRRLVKQTPEARAAAQQAIQNARHQVAMKKTVGRKAGSLVPLKLKNPNMKVTRERMWDLKLVEEGGGDIEDHFRIRFSMDKSGDEIGVVWHPRPEKKIERIAGKATADDMKAVVVWYPSSEDKAQGIAGERNPDDIKAVVVWHPGPAREAEIDTKRPVADEKRDFMGWYSNLQEMVGRISINLAVDVTKNGMVWYASAKKLELTAHDTKAMVVWHSSSEKQVERRVAKLAIGRTKDLIVWYAKSKKVERIARQPAVNDMKDVVVWHDKGSTLVEDIRQQSRAKSVLKQAVSPVARTVWWLVKPVFNSHSLLRRGLEEFPGFWRFRWEVKVFGI